MKPGEEKAVERVMKQLAKEGFIEPEVENPSEERAIRLALAEGREEERRELANPKTIKDLVKLTKILPAVAEVDKQARLSERRRVLEEVEKWLYRNSILSPAGMKDWQSLKRRLGKRGSEPQVFPCRQTPGPRPTPKRQRRKP